eukprot:4756731-Alexandrium_andersonii.AAC.1
MSVRLERRDEPCTAPRRGQPRALSKQEAGAGSAASRAARAGKPAIRPCSRSMERPEAGAK